MTFQVLSNLKSLNYNKFYILKLSIFELYNEDLFGIKSYYC